MLKYLAKFASDILPSVAATIIGAYIVNHYITARPDAPPLAASSASAASKPSAGKPAGPATEVASIPAAGVRAKGISEKAVFGRAADEKPQEKGQEKETEKAGEKPEDKPAETASISADIHRRPGMPHEKTAIRTIPLTAPAVQPAASTSVPASPAAAVEAAVNPDEHRDANDLARAAIERLRENSPRPQDGARAADAPRVAAVPAQASAVQPLPPPVMVAAPAGDVFGPGASSQQAPQPYPSSIQARDPSRPVPPADIPSPEPLELRTDNSGIPPLQQHNKNVAEDMLSAAKSVFHAVLPQ